MMCLDFSFYQCILLVSRFFQFQDCVIYLFSSQRFHFFHSLSSLLKLLLDKFGNCLKLSILSLKRFHHATFFHLLFLGLIFKNSFIKIYFTYKINSLKVCSSVVFSYFHTVVKLPPHPIENVFQYPRKKPMPFSIYFSVPSNHWFTFCLWIYLFQTYHEMENI